MLKFFSRLERTRNVLLFLVAALMALSLIFFYAPTNSNMTGDLTRNQETVAQVGGEKVTVADLAVQKENASQFGRGLPGKFLLDGLIRERIVRGEAERLGLTATDAEVADTIRRQFRAADGGGTFNQETYERRVTEQFGGVANFEQAVRDQLSGQKLEAFLTSGVTVSEEEVLNDYKRKNTKFDLSYVPVSSPDLAQTIKPSDDELRSYFERNKASFYIGGPQKKIRYVFLNTSKIGEKLDISEEDLRAEYEKIPADKKQAGVEGQQIVLRIPNAQAEAQVTAKANEITAVARSKDDGKITEESFAEIARGQSEDTRSAANGGKLSGLVRANPNNPSDPYQRLLPMQPGDVTEPIKYQDKFYILRRGEAVAKNYEDARREIEVSLKNRRAYAAAAELAQKVTERLRQNKDVQAVAQEFAAQANMTPQEMIRETGFVKPGDEVENVGISPQFEEGIAALENQGDVGDKIPVQNGFAVPLLIEKRDPRDAEFAEVKDKVAEAYKLEQARARVEEIAKQITGDAGSANNLEAAAQSKGLKAQESKSFILGSPLGQGPSATTNEALEDAIYNLRIGEVTKTPVKIGDNFYVVGVRGREEASNEEFAKQRDELVQAQLTEKRGQVFSDYLASRRREMETGGDIKIFKDALDKVDAADDAALPEDAG
ncbi:MAG TPA: peptidylprolyl isomerase [Pyrinomonadaceae bacterium]|nr:peptidylprolyl isomerase [Pyrinomonadaceae bacterium]